MSGRNSSDFKGEQRIGSYRVTCDRSGFECWAEDTVMEWDGLRVKREFADMFRQPQDFVRGVPDYQNVPNPRPEPPDVFIAPGDVLPGDL